MRAYILTTAKIFQFPHSTCRIIGQHALCGKENLSGREYSSVCLRPKKRGVIILATGAIPHMWFRYRISTGTTQMTYEEFCTRFHIQLNEQQTEAVHSVEGPVLLLAVPGSGKTTVLITRLGYMIYCVGIAPRQILTLTYTVAATHDMAARFCSYFGEELGGRLEFRTINGVCARIIQYYGRLIGKNAFSLVTDEKLTTGMLSAIYQKVEGGYAAGSDIKNIRTLITYIKNRMLTGEEIRRLDETCGFRISEIHNAYCTGLRSQGLMDYDDQMIYAHTILRKSPETLQYFQDRYPYICVDEAQDTSKIQHEIIRLLAGERSQLFMVGDEDQSIYGFRAAYPEALMSFEQNYPEAKVLLMEENFRSNARIVEAADHFIQKNTMRHQKHMRAARPAGAEIREIDLKSRSAQYRYLLKVADGCQTKTAVLYRDNESVLPLVDLLDRQKIPYRIRNAELTFFTHRVVLDIQNIILFAENPRDTELFMQIYYKISTYISRQNAVQICEISREKGIDILEAAIFYGELGQKKRESCLEVRSGLRKLLTDSAEQAVNRIVRNLGYGEYLKRAELGEGKLFILRTLARNEASPQRLVKRLAELQEVINKNPNNSKCKFILSTIHASKGLEYDTVYLMDVIDGIFPESMPEAGALEIYEEERRLFYVGVTRAKERLFLFTVNWKSVFGKEFLHGAASVHPEQAQEKAGILISTVKPVYGGIVRKKAFSQEAFSEFCQALGEGLLVRHKKFGEGVIVKMEEKRVVIRFKEQERRFELRILFENDLLEYH